MDNPAPEFVIRLGEVALDRSELERILGIRLDRYEPSRHDALPYAQLSMAEGDDWPAVMRFLEVIGPRLADLVRRKAIGSASMDFEIFVAIETAATFSVPIPAEVASLAGRNLIDIEVSIYPLFPRS